VWGGPLAGLGESPLEGVREDSLELGGLVDGTALDSPRGPDVRVEAPEVAHRGEIVGSSRIDDDVDATDRADLALHHVPAVVAGGLVALTGELVEPFAEGESQHDGPLSLGDVDGPTTDARGAGDDVQSHLLHPRHVSIAVGVLATVHTVRTADGVQIAGLVVTEDLVPADAVEAPDRVGGGVDSVSWSAALDREVEGVRAVTRLELSDVDSAHMNLLVER